MSDNIYCYPDSTVLKNKLNITDKYKLFEAEKEFTAIRLKEQQDVPLEGEYDFNHLKAIHKYIFQDIYEWAGQERKVEIGKGNLFCTIACMPEFAISVFDKYYPQCYQNRNRRDDFIRVLADNYGDLNALHPFREGNGRTQREFARIVCMSCGYEFNLSCTTHQEMLNASVLSFDKGDSSGFIDIFKKAIVPYCEETASNMEKLNILTADDLLIDIQEHYDYYAYNEHIQSEICDNIYKAKISKMNAEKIISDAYAEIKKET